MRVMRRTRLAWLAAVGLVSAGVVGCAYPGPTPSDYPIAGVGNESDALATPLMHAGQTRTDAHGVEQVWVPAGTFTMGSTDAQVSALTAQNPPGAVLGEFPSEQPARQVTITRGYWIDKNEVTNESFDAFAAAGGYESQAWWSAEGWAWLQAQPDRPNTDYCLGDDAKDPARCLTWFEAEAYAEWRTGRLPTEAEWEFAARGEKSQVYPWGNDWDASRCNVEGSAGPTKVGSYPTGASWVGAQDMAGNAMEWVSDWLDVNYYKSGAAQDPQGPAAGSVKVEKGGWWDSNRFVARSAYRHYEDPPTYSDMHIGFRIVTPQG
jgi:formylglycine-generating enzyme required for sulfatase activity